jgi:hypothetical protein
MILYGVGTKRIFAVADVTSDWKINDEQGWPFRVDIQLEVNVAPSAGIDVNTVSADLSVRLRRRSHMRLTREEFESAAGKLRKASAKV